MSEFLSIDSLYNPLTPYSPYSMTRDTLSLFPTPSVFMGDFRSTYMTQPSTNYYQMGQEYMASIKANMALNSAVQSLASLESQVKETVGNEALNDSQKQRLQEILDKIEALKEEIQNSQNKSAAEKQALIEKISQLQEEAAKVAGEISEEIQAAAASDDGGNDTNTDVSDAATETPEDVNSPVAQKMTKEQENEALEICQSIYQGAIGECGTEYDYIIDGYNGMKGTNAITKDNVTAVLNKWQEQFANGSGDKNVIETLFAEEMMWNPSLKDRGPDGKIADPEHNVDIIWNIVKCLEERAKELGVYNKLIGQFTAAYNQLDDTCVDQSVVENAVMAINQAVTTAENAKKAEDAKKQKEAEQKKTDDENKVKADEAKKQAEKEATDTFLGDMREIWKDDKLEISDKVKYKDGKFVIRIQGIEYSGKDFNELCDNIAKAGYDDPKEYLSKQDMDVAA